MKEKKFKPKNLRRNIAIDYALTYDTIYMGNDFIVPLKKDEECYVINKLTISSLTFPVFFYTAGAWLFFGMFLCILDWSEQTILLLWGCSFFAAVLIWITIRHKKYKIKLSAAKGNFKYAIDYNVFSEYDGKGHFIERFLFINNFILDNQGFAHIKFCPDQEQPSPFILKKYDEILKDIKIEYTSIYDNETGKKLLANELKVFLEEGEK